MIWKTEYAKYEIDYYKATLDEWINSTKNDKGFYRDITEEIEELDLDIQVVIQGNKDTIYILGTDSYGNINYYIGHLEIIG